MKIKTSKRSDGSMRSGGKDNISTIKEFQSKYFPKLNLITLSQIHSSKIINTSSKKRKGDGLVSSNRKEALGIFTADCVPVIAADENKQVLAAIHAGYKGIILGITKNMIRAMENEGAEKENINVYLGPSIGICCYDIQQQRKKLFLDTFTHANQALLEKNGKIYIELKTIIKNELIKLGIIESSISINEECTKCSDDYFSYRNETDLTGHMITIASL